MKQTKSETGVERRILTGMIVSDSFLRQISKVYDKDCLTAYARTVAKWCLDYYKAHEEAPKKNITALYDRAVRNGMDTTQMEIVENFLSGLSNEFNGSYNAELNLADALEYFQKKRLNNLLLDVTAELSENKVESAVKIWKDYKPVHIPRAEGVDLFDDADLRWRMFNTVFEPLYTLPGDLGRFMNRQLIRKGFLAFQGADKRGKSWWLSYMALQAALGHNNVAIYTLADLSSEEYKERFTLQQLHRPLFEEDCEERIAPVLDCENNQNGSCNMAIRECRTACLDGEGKLMDNPDYRPCTACRDRYDMKFQPCVYQVKKPIQEPVTIVESQRADAMFIQHMGGKSVRIIESPSNSVSPQDIENDLNEWKDDGWIPDVLIVDYADAMAPSTKFGDKRERIDSVWQGLNKIRQEWNLLLVTATHTNRSGYSAEHLEMGHESESRTKNAHVTGMIGLNQNDEEQGMGVMRLNWVNRRKGRYQSSKCVTVLQDLAGGYVCLDSY